MDSEVGQRLQDVVNDAECSVCEGHESDHTGCANAVQHFLRQSEAARDALAARVRELEEENDRMANFEPGLLTGAELDTHPEDL